MKLKYEWIMFFYKNTSYKNYIYYHLLVLVSFDEKRWSNEVVILGMLTLRIFLLFFYGNYVKFLIY